MTAALLLSFVIGQAAPPPAEQAVASTLDRLHHAAATANETGYFACFTEDAVFLGTDASERWTLSEFRRYAHPHFASGKGWTYVPRPGSRHVTFAGDVAWFDEIVDSPKYGACRGTGVLRRVGNGWRVALYSLTLLVPNALADRVTALTRPRAAH